MPKKTKRKSKKRLKQESTETLETKLEDNEFDNLIEVDMHVHTQYSHDSNTSIKKIVDKCKRTGMGVAITDHNEIKGALDIARYRSVFSIPGIEVDTKEMTHLCFYFTNTKDLKKFYLEIKPYMTQEATFSKLDLETTELIKTARKYNGYMSIPHPYTKGTWNGALEDNFSEELINEADFMEVFNAFNTKKDNIRARDLATKYNKPQCGGSDAHYLGEVFRGVTRAEGKTSAEFLANVAAGKSQAYGKQIRLVKKALNVLHHEAERYLRMDKQTRQERRQYQLMRTNDRYQKKAEKGIDKTTTRAVNRIIQLINMI